MVSKKIYIITLIKMLISVTDNKKERGKIFFVALGFEVRTLHLQGRHSTT
jgi:hypothetical protein